MTACGNGEDGTPCSNILYWNRHVQLYVVNVSMCEVLLSVVTASVLLSVVVFCTEAGMSIF